MSSSSILLLVCLYLIAVSQVDGFFVGNGHSGNVRLKMMFGGGGAKKSGAVIKVEGKTIVAASTPCNLRKELQANNIGESHSHLHNETMFYSMILFNTNSIAEI